MELEDTFHARNQRGVGQDTQENHKFSKFGPSWNKLDPLPTWNFGQLSLTLPL